MLLAEADNAVDTLLFEPLEAGIGRLRGAVEAAWRDDPEVAHRHTSHGTRSGGVLPRGRRRDGGERVIALRDGGAGAQTGDEQRAAGDPGGNGEAVRTVLHRVDDQAGEGGDQDHLI